MRIEFTGGKSNSCKMKQFKEILSMVTPTSTSTIISEDEVQCDTAFWENILNFYIYINIYAVQHFNNNKEQY